MLLILAKGDVTPDARAIQNADVIVTTPEKWDGISRSWQTRQYVQAVALIVIDEIHLLGEDRGPVLEVTVVIQLVTYPSIICMKALDFPRLLMLGPS